MLRKELNLKELVDLLDEAYNTSVVLKHFCCDYPEIEEISNIIKACKEFLNIEDLEILKCEIDGAEEIYLPPKIEVKKEKPEKYNPAVKPLFKTSRERYEYLMEYGCTCNDDRVWLTNYKETKEFKEYETDIC